MRLQDDGPDLYVYIFELGALSERSQQIIHEYKQLSQVTPFAFVREN